MKAILFVTTAFLLFNCQNRNNKPREKIMTSLDSTRQIYQSAIAEDRKLDSIAELGRLFWGRIPGEAKLDSKCNETYRFYWNRSMEAPVTITICNCAENYSLVTRKMVGKDSIITINEVLLKGQWNEFKREIEGAYFWSIGVQDVIDPNSIRLDGSSWTLEGKRQFEMNENRKYHFVSRPSPKTGNFRNACLKLIEFSSLASKETIY